MQLKLIGIILYWILFIIAGLIVIAVLMGCHRVTLDDYVCAGKYYMYNGEMYCPIRYFEEKEGEAE